MQDDRTTAYTRRNCGRCPRAVRELLLHAGWKSDRGGAWSPPAWWGSQGRWYWDGALLECFDDVVARQVMHARGFEA